MASNVDLPLSDLKEKLAALPPLRDVINDNDLRAEKKFGQNFLLDLNLTDKIARAAGDLSGATVFEIGPGPGGLTRSLLCSTAPHVVAIEFDPRAIHALSGLKSAVGDALTLIEGDALDKNLIEMSEAPRAIVANLPYNVATPLLIKWLKDIREDQNAYRSMTLMFQKEVGERITAKCGDKAYGRLGVIAQWLCDAYLAFDVPASAFTPPPKVTSSIVYLQPKDIGVDAPSFKAVERVTAAAFGQRRKMIRSSLKNYKHLFAECGLEETVRAENLGVQQFIKLARLSEKDGIE